MDTHKYYFPVLVTTLNQLRNSTEVERVREMIFFFASDLLYVVSKSSLRMRQAGVKDGWLPS